MAQKPAQRIRRRERKNIVSGVAHVNASFNNTVVNITDAQGNTISWSSAGTKGFKGSRKSTPYAATVTTEAAVKKAVNEYSLRRVDIFVKGIGPGREASLRVIRGSDLDIDNIVDMTPVPHNGVRPPKIRRV